MKQELVNRTVNIGSDEQKLKKVLVVDDEPHIVNLIRMSLDDTKFRVFGAYSAVEALELVKKQVPDVFVIDLMMPKIDGYKLCSMLREDSRTKNVPIIILSAKGQMKDKLNAIDVGADDYITKPFDPLELEKRINLNLETAKI